MPIELATQFIGAVDELFATESKHSLVTNQDFSWDGASTIKVYSISTSDMNDYGRSGPDGSNWSRYGPVAGLNATTQAMQLRKDRSFTFAIDKLDENETKRALQAATALARQVREVVIPEVDAWVFEQMIEHAGHTPAAVALTATNIFESIIAGSNALDNAEVPDMERVLIVAPDTYQLMKKSKDIIMETDIGADMRLRGIVSNLDGLAVMRVPSTRLPSDFGFMIAHRVATVAPTKLEDYKIHEDPPGINGSLVEGRINYDAFVLKNKTEAIYYQEMS